MNYLITLYNEHDLLQDRLREIRRLDPGANILIITDGDNYPSPDKDCIYIPTRERLKIASDKPQGAWIDRYLRAFMDNTSEGDLLKIDPDTKLNKRPYIHKGYDVVAKVHTHPSGRVVMESNALYMTRYAIKRVLDSKYLLESRKDRYTYTTATSTKILMLDWILFDVVYRCDLRIGSWSDTSWYAHPRSK